MRPTDISSAGLMQESHCSGCVESGLLALVLEELLVCEDICLLAAPALHLQENHPVIMKRIRDAPVPERL